eukprot:Opistho-1_new@43280
MSRSGTPSSLHAWTKRSTFSMTRMCGIFCPGSFGTLGLCFGRSRKALARLSTRMPSVIFLGRSVTTSSSSSSERSMPASSSSANLMRSQRSVMALSWMFLRRSVRRCDTDPPMLRRPVRGFTSPSSFSGRVDMVRDDRRPAEAPAGPSSSAAISPSANWTSSSNCTRARFAFFFSAGATSMESRRAPAVLCTACADARSSVGEDSPCSSLRMVSTSVLTEWCMLRARATSDARLPGSAVESCWRRRSVAVRTSSDVDSAIDWAAWRSCVPKPASDCCACSTAVSCCTIASMSSLARRSSSSVWRPAAISSSAFSWALLSSFCSSSPPIAAAATAPTAPKAATVPRAAALATAMPDDAAPLLRSVSPIASKASAERPTFEARSIVGSTGCPAAACAANLALRRAATCSYPGACLYWGTTTAGGSAGFTDGARGRASTCSYVGAAR